MKLLLIVLFCISTGTVLYSLSMPTYVSESAKLEIKKLDDEASDLLKQNKFYTDAWKEFEKRYYQKVRSLRSNKNIIMDWGLGISSLALSSLAFTFILKIKKINEVIELTSPTSRKLFLIACLSWLGLIPAGWVHFIRTFLREDYPWFADSIAIPIFQQIFGCLIILPVIIAFVLSVNSRARYPAVLSTRFYKYDFMKIALECLFCFLLILSTYNLSMGVSRGDFLEVPIDLIGIYVVLSLRAGMIRKHNESEIIIP